jgi:charged multivesicular body protein 4
MTLEQQKINLEGAQTNAAAVGALKTGVEVQKNMNKELNLDKVDDLMDDIAEQNDVQNELNEVFAQQANMVGEDDDLEAELEALETQMLEEDLLGANTAPSAAPQATPAKAPAAATPSTKSPEANPAALNTSEEEQLAALQAELQFA